MKFRRGVGSDWIQPCGHAAARFTKLLYIKRLLDNLIPLGDMVKSFLCQFSPSLLFKPPLSSCSPTMQDCALFFMFSYIFSLYGCHPQTPQTACSLCKWSAFHAQSWMRPQQNLSLVLPHTQTHTHTAWLSVKIRSSIIFNFCIWFTIF